MESFSAHSFVQTAIANSDKLNPYTEECIGKLGKLSIRQIKLVRSELERTATSDASEDGSVAILLGLTKRFLEGVKK